VNQFAILFKKRKAKIILVCVGIFILLFMAYLIIPKEKEEKVFQFSASSTTIPYEVALYNDRSTVMYNPEQGWILQSYSPRDCVVTPFLPVGSNMFYKKNIHVEFLFPPDTPPERRPTVFLQNKRCDSLTPALVAYSHATGNSFNMDAMLIASEIRINMVPPTGEDVVLPDQIICSSEESLIKANEIFDFVKMFVKQKLAQLFLGFVLGLTIAGFCVYKKLGHFSIINQDQSSTALNTHRPYLALIALSCVISSLIYPFFWENGFIDPFFYLAYQLHFPEYYKEIFPGTYYGSRLGVILPGYLAHKIFSPVVAQLALIWFKSFLGAFSLYAFLVRIRGHLAAMLTAVVFSLWPWVGCAMSSLYVDGYGVAYYLLTAALVMQARHSTKPRKWLFAGGVGMGLAFSSNIFCVLHCIPLIVFYMFDGRQKTCRHYVHDFAFLTSWMGFGFITLLCAFGLLSRAFGGSFFFFTPSFWNIIALSTSNPWAPKGYSFLRTVYYLDVQFIAGITAVIGLVVWLIHRRRSKKNWELSHTVSLVYFMTFLLHCLFSGKGMNLHLSYYTSYLFGISFITLGCFIHIERKRTLAVALCIISLALIGARFGTPVIIRLGPAVFLGLSITALFYTLISAGTFVCSSRAGVFIITVYLCWAAFYSGHYTIPRQFIQGRGDYNRVIDVNNYIWTHADNRNVQFWYDGKESYEYTNHASMYLWGYRLMGVSFPELPESTIGAATVLSILPPPGTDVVVLSKRADAADMTQDIFAQHGIAAALYSESSFGNADDMFTVFVFKTSILKESNDV